MSNCQKCGARTQLHLCGTCELDLERMLEGLAVGRVTNRLTGDSRPSAGLLEHLADAALGQTRLGASERRSNERGSPLPVPVGPNGDFKDSPSELYAGIVRMLRGWSAVVSLGTETLAVKGEQ